jgi:hypothetical protein
LVLAVACKKQLTLQEKMSGSWEATMPTGLRASKDPLVRGFGRAFTRDDRLAISLRVSETRVELERYSGVEDQRVTQAASYTVVDGEHIELDTSAGKTRVRVTPNGCDEHDCWGVQFDPVDPAAPAVTALAYLFGCDDVSGRIDCAKREGSRLFFRPGDAGVR